MTAMGPAATIALQLASELLSFSPERVSGFLAIVLFMIVIIDKPFYGYVSITADPYKLILDKLIAISR